MKIARISEGVAFVFVPGGALVRLLRTGQTLHLSGEAANLLSSVSRGEAVEVEDMPRDLFESGVLSVTDES